MEDLEANRNVILAQKGASGAICSESESESEWFGMEMVTAVSQLGTKQDTEITQFFLLDFPALVFFLRTEVSSSTNFMNNLSEKEVGKKLHQNGKMKN